MILDGLLKVTSLGARQPLELWRDDFIKTAPSLVKALIKIHESLENDTDVKKEIKELIEILKGEHPDEFLLADHLLQLSAVFLNNTSANKQGVIQAYFETSKVFHKRAQMAWLHKQQREKIKQSLNQQEQEKYDLRLFKGEGMMYILEFYLAVYKAIIDAPSEEERRSFIESPEINLGFGGVPGLLKDLQNDEALEKFISKILDDEIRIKLICGYYDFKSRLDSDIIEGLKDFLNGLLLVFQEVGIEQLASAFFKPFGDKPHLSEIKL